MSELAELGYLTKKKYKKEFLEHRKKSELKEIRGIWKNNKLVGSKYVYKSFRKQIKEDIKKFLGIKRVKPVKKVIRLVYDK